MKQLTFADVVAAAEKLGDKIKASGFKFDYLVGIATGGLYPLALLAKELDNKNILTITANSDLVGGHKVVTIQCFPQINLRNKNILLIDDITDSGETLKEISKLITNRYQPKTLKTATLGSNLDNSKFLPDFYELEEKGEWLKFPWEKEDFPVYPYT